MRINDFQNIIEVIKQDVLQSEEEYLKLLRVVGKNQRYNFVNQLSIYDRNPNATACAKFDYWKQELNRVVQRGQKGIPIFEDYGTYQRVDHVFDITQTVSRNREVNEVKLWAFDKEDNDVLMELIADEGYIESDKLEENIKLLCKIYGEEKFYSLMNDLRITDSERLEFQKFLENSLAVATSSRLGIDIEIDTDVIKNGLNKLDSISLMRVGDTISSLNRYTVEKVMARSKEKSLNRPLTIGVGAEYNRGGEDKNIEQGGELNDVFRRNDNRQENERVFGIRDDSRNSEQDRGNNAERLGGEYGVSGEVSESDLRNDETVLSGNERERGEMGDAHRPLLRQDADESLDGNARDGNQDDERGKTEDDEVLWTDGGTESGRSAEIRTADEQHDISLEGSHYQGSSRSLSEKDIEETEGASEAPFFYSKENPSDLMPVEILERVPSFYSEEDVPFADKTVHAAYFIPFRSDWTWYLTEYDKETGDAFGLVLGFEAEWGYFNLNELKELNAQRYILEDFPKTFRELKDTELKKQMSEEELNICFNGQLSFEESSIATEDKEKRDDLEFVSEKREYSRNFLDECRETALEFNVSLDEAIERITKSKLDTAIHLNGYSRSDFDYPQVTELVSMIQLYEFDPYYLGMLTHANLPSWKMEQMKWLIDDFVKGENNLSDEGLRFLRDSHFDIAKFNVIKNVIANNEITLEEAKILDEKAEELSMSEFMAEISSYKDNNKETEKLAIKVGTEFVIVDESAVSYIQKEETGQSVTVDGITYPLYRGTHFGESTKVDVLIDSGDYLVYKIDEHTEEKAKQVNIFDLEAKKREEKSLTEDGEKSLDLSKGRLVYYNHDSYTISREPIKNEILGGYDLWLSPNRDGNHEIPIVHFKNDEELLSKISFNRPEFLIGDEVLYKDRECTIEGFDESSGIRTVTVKDNQGYLDGMITASEVIIYRDDNALSTFLTLIEQQSQAELKPGKEDIKAENFRLETSTLAESLTPSERLDNNIRAIETLITLEKEERNATKDEQEVLAKYVGWGGLSDVFDESKKGQWQSAREFLKANLSQEEFERARESTLTSFYTPKVVIDSIYSSLEKMGFSKGNILEPSMGIGHFMGSLPQSMEESKFYGVELDTLSARIAAKLYPNHNIQAKGFEETTFSNNFFDIAVGNVPFGDFKVNDREYDKNNFLIHDYFFAKSIDKVRNGGIIAFITSSGTMDKKDESVRRYLAARAELVGAIRLPNDTFKGVAGTEVTSDILFFKKHDSVRERDEDWVHLATDENGLTYNKYFVDNPHMVLGEIKEVSGRFGNKIECIADGTDLKERLEQASISVSENAKYEEVFAEEEEVVTLPATDDIKNFAYCLVDGEVYQRENSVLIKQDVTDKVKEKIADYLEVTESLKEVIRVQKEDYSDDVVAKAQERLNETYDNYFKKHGFINSYANTRALKDDSNFPLVSSIEILDEENNFKEKGDIFHKRTIVKAKVIDRVDTSLEALVLSVSQKAKVDLDYMSSLTGKGKNELVDELRGEIFLNIAEYDAFTNRLPFQNARNEDNFRFSYVTSDEYLSGNIREKLGIIDEYIRNTHKELRQNAYYQGDRRIELSDDERESLERELVELEWQRGRLKEVLPKELTASEINVRLGATWIPTKDIERFIFETLKTPAYNRWDIKVKFSEQTSEWNIEGKSKDYGNDLANMTYGTSRVNAYKLIEDALNLKETKVFDQIENPDGTKKSVLNKKETLLAGQKQELLKEEFKNFIFEEPERRSRLEKLYNERFNSIRNREYNGENLSFEGMNAEITLREHQRNAIARSLYGGNTLLAHVVGSGKTYEMVASAMESKRLGLCSKSLFVVPNHLTGQIGREFMQLYPGANIMVADKKDFEPKNRKRFIGRIATGEYDAVVIGHTQFEKIPMSKEYQEKHIADQIDEIVNYINEYKHDRNQNFTVKQLEKTRKKLEARLEKLNDDFKKDDVITFEELGVDKLFVDEAHSYKNLYLYTKMRNIAGIGQSEAIKSSDMYMKCRYMDEITGGKGIVFATGTPISNSMTELYTMQRYLQYDELKKMGLENFDSWAANFGETVSAFELSPEGTGYRVKTRFSKFFNIPELMSMFKEVADIQTADMLDLPTPNAHYEVIKTMPSEEQKEVLASLATRADDVRERRVEPEEDNMLKITNDGKKLALDQRLINPLLPDDPNSKVNVCVKNIFAIWDKTTDKRSTQLVFSDMSTPKGDGEFNIYDDIRDKLVNMGVPKEEIAFIHEANTDKQKDDLFAKVRRGEVRILLGSTQKMGAGTNVQNKLIALHDLDVPWRPSDLEQRAGRIVRQGNENSDVNIFRYVTENTFDAYLWQTIENKQKFISQIMTSKTPARVAEDVDESSLNYAEIKALATGNPLIKEKMDLDNEVVKLKMLESNYKSNRYRLEDKVVKSYPEEIKRLETLIEAVREDIRTAEPLGKGEDKFTSISLNGEEIRDKKLAGEKLLETVKKVGIFEKKTIGKYRNFDLEVKYDSFRNQYNFNLCGKTKHSGELGSSPDGNLIRLDNVIEKMTDKLARYEQNLETTKEQLENAKNELTKPFEKADELKSKVLRLAELNRLLDMGDVEEKVNESPLLENLKRAIVDFCKYEYEDERYTYEAFDTLFPDLSHVGIAYTTTPDGEYEIQFELNLTDYTATQYVNGTAVSHYDYLKENGSVEKALDVMKFEMENGDFATFVAVDEEELKVAMGLDIDDDGNFYDPLSKDLDNDGIPDRYDHDFRDSDYEESTFDIDGLKKHEKPSILEQIKSYQNDEKTLDKQDNKEKEKER